MLTLKNFVVVILTVVLCMFIRMASVLAANTIDTLTTSTSSTVEIYSDSETISYSIHAPPQDNLNENQSIIKNYEDFSPRITLTVEDDIVVETFYPTEYEHEFLEKKESDYSGDDIIFMIPLVTQNHSNYDMSDSEVVFALALNMTDFPDFPEDDTMVQCGFMSFF